MSGAARRSHIVVTGASSGIGAATAERFASRGCAISLVARREDRLHDVARAVEQHGGTAEVITADVGSRAGCERAIAQAQHSFGPVDVLVNNAGMPGGVAFSLIDVEQIERVMNVNFLSAVWCTKAVLDAMPRGSSIVNVASIAGKIGIPRAGAYVASKYALVGFGEALWFELRARGIDVITVNPGPVRTESFPHRMLRGRMVLSPDDLARAIVRAVDRGTPEITVPRYYRIGPILNAVVPPLYRRALRAFADRTPDELSPE